MTNQIIKEIKEDAEKIRLAQMRQETLLAQAFPVGTKVLVKLRYGQKNLTEMEVVSHSGGSFPLIACRMEGAISKYGRQKPCFRRSVSLEDIKPSNQ